MPISSEGEKVPQVTMPTGSPPARTGLPWRGMPAPSILNGASFSAVPSARARAIASAPTKPGRLRAAPAEPGLDRVALRAQVVAVQVEADLEPQRVAGAEPAGDDAGVEQLGPDRRRDLGVDQQLDPVLAGVAGAADERRAAADPRRGDPHPRRQLDPERAGDDRRGRAGPARRASRSGRRRRARRRRSSRLQRPSQARSAAWLAELVTIR